MTCQFTDVLHGDSQLVKEISLKLCYKEKTIGIIFTEPEQKAIGRETSTIGWQCFTKSKKCLGFSLISHVLGQIVNRIFNRFH